ncbi:MAG TPA: ferritin-like domain-containing protein [Alphaproteobacteria bacterium]|nr:ferritin-like domain-containing protein [Alphaproteobacteria bacterium]
MADTARDHFINWLRDAYAMERQACDMIENTLPRVTEFQTLHSRLQQHLTESQQQADRVERALHELGADTSAIKTGIAKLMGNLGTMANMVNSDEPVKAVIAHYSWEHFEIGNYRSHISTARSMGFAEIARMFEESLREEEAMQAFLAEQIPLVTAQFLQSEGGTVAGASGTDAVTHAQGATTEDASISNIGSMPDGTRVVRDTSI